MSVRNHTITHFARLKAIVKRKQSCISKPVNWHSNRNFCFYKLDEKIFDAGENIDTASNFENLAAHLWFSKTKIPFNKPLVKSTRFATNNNISYVFLYNGLLKGKHIEDSNILTNKILNIFLDDMKHQSYKKLVSYEESSQISQVRLRSLNIESNQIHYKIKARE